ncbi:MAG: VOC family protein [Actinomycetota bacterium]|nr:VOC family protein [Actinomycetota bacterium]
MNLFQVNLFVSDFEEAFCFYRDRLGLQVHDIDPGPPSVPLVNWASLSAGSVFLELFDAQSFGRGSPRASGRDTIEPAFIVDDVDESRERLETAGVACGPVTQEQWGRFASFPDPDGTMLQTFEVVDSRDGPDTAATTNRVT